MADHQCPSTITKTAVSTPLPATTPPKSVQIPVNPLENVAAPNISYYTPQQHIPAGTAITRKDNPKPLPKVFTPLKLRGLTLQNRVIVSPMCQYSADDGHLTMWHITHLGGILQRGPGLTIIEATAVTPEGRISPQDSGLWKDSQIEPLKKIVEFAHSQGQKIAIQLAHAGRKASTVAPWINRKAVATADVGGWPDNVLSASNDAFDAPHTVVPRVMTLEDIASFKQSFIDSVNRALKAGVDAIEIHAAHGYLLHATLSAATNKLPAPYSGSLENRMRLLLELTTLVRAAIPESMPLLVRIPGSDWMPPESNCWEINQAIALSLELTKLGVDFLDVSSAALMVEQKVVSGPGYQVPFADAIRKALVEAGRGEATKVGTVGMITSGVQAEEILQDGKADAVLVARGFQKSPGLVWDWAAELGVEVRVANQIGWGVGQRPTGGVKGGDAPGAVKDKS
ncbi:putative NADPH dehydrogenase C23G7.10c [Mollisia scopiformis]|uniref:Putative NADPH dehydrogenase C23G7.10c n=1 Tax=Mollisia scopiformis TaxID=149040 RepID=A0A194WX95_MOLSC|nr:putative NADPH dehydrogenase C23G7.10c [Mollisia scopiformis]KUJ12212.1 putative NADPH dehydrogenase C23G7.10c [Mollisia scopiformis]